MSAPPAASEPAAPAGSASNRPAAAPEPASALPIAAARTNERRDTGAIATLPSDAFPLMAGGIGIGRVPA